MPWRVAADAIISSCASDSMVYARTGAFDETRASIRSASLWTPEMTSLSCETPSSAQMLSSPGEQTSRPSTIGSSSGTTKVFAFIA